MARTPSCEKSTGMRKGTWTQEEDRKLIAYITRYGCWNWRQLPKFAGLQRCGKSCRLRWLNYLRPNLKRGNFTQQEEQVIIKLHKKLGNRWAAISAVLPGRTDNEVKNHWHTALKRRVQENTANNAETKISYSKNGFGSLQEVTPPATSQISDSTGSLSPLSSSSEFSCATSDQNQTTACSGNENFMFEDDFDFLDPFTEHVNENFWSELQIDTNCALQNQDSATQILDPACALSPNQSSGESLILDDDLFGSFLDANTDPTFDNFWGKPYVTADTCFLAEAEDFCTVYDADLWSQ